MNTKAMAVTPRTPKSDINAIPVLETPLERVVTFASLDGSVDALLSLFAGVFVVGEVVGAADGFEVALLTPFDCPL